MVRNKMLTKELYEIIKQFQQRILEKRSSFSLKEDNSYVSEGDLLVQSIVTEWVRKRLPSHIIISEEMETANINWNQYGSYVVLDPIDGTENFVSGLKEWGIGLSVYTNGKHQESFIMLPEIDDYQITGMQIRHHKSRIVGLSSSLNFSDLSNLKWKSDVEYRIIGCAMYNLLMTARGSFKAFENIKGVNCWDILPGLNIAKEHGCKTFVDDVPYQGQILFPTKKYSVRIEQGDNNEVAS